MARVGGPTDKSHVSGPSPAGERKGKSAPKDLQNLAGGVQHAASRVFKSHQ
jgi:hypothetical protein